jgi:hypothetical protein
LKTNSFGLDYFFSKTLDCVICLGLAEKVFNQPFFAFGEKTAGGVGVGVGDCRPKTPVNLLK